MKFAAIAVFLGALTMTQASALPESAVEEKLTNLLEKNDLLVQKQDLLEQLTSIDGKLRIMATSEEPKGGAKVSAKVEVKSTEEPTDEEKAAAFKS